MAIRDAASNLGVPDVSVVEPAVATTDNYRIVYPDCPEDNYTIIIDPVLGGAGNQSSYWINWYKYTGDFSQCTNVQYPYGPQNCTGFPTSSHKKRIRFAIPSTYIWASFASGPNVLDFYFQFDGDLVYPGFYPLNSTFPTPQTNYAQTIIAALAYPGRAVNVYGSTFIDIYMQETDPYYNATEYLIILPNNSTNNTTFSEPKPGSVFFCNLLQQKQICGRQLLAGGIAQFSFSTLESGIYVAEVIDTIGVTNEAVIEINEVKKLPCKANITHVSCYGKNNGSIELLINDKDFDADALHFQWVDSVDLRVVSNNMNLYNVPASTYFLRVSAKNPGFKDSLPEGKGNQRYCTRNCCFQIREPEVLEIKILEHINPSCVQCRDSSRYGYVMFEVCGGNINCSEDLDSPYQYSINGGKWESVDLDNRKILNNLAVGIYVIRVKDCGSCYATYTLIIKENLLDVKI